MAQKPIGKLLLLLATIFLGTNCQGIFALNANDCPTNFYYDIPNYTCWPCPPTCYSCINKNICTICKDGIGPYYGKCNGTAQVPTPAPAPTPTPAPTPNCGRGFYWSPAGFCLPCSSVCTTCSASANYCTSCTPPLIIASGGNCVYNPANGGQMGPFGPILVAPGP